MPQLSGKKQVSRAREGSTVSVHYTISLQDGTVFDTTIFDSPKIFTVGEGRVIPGMEQAVIGMKPGESKTVEIPPRQAFGFYDRHLVKRVKRNQIRPDRKPTVGELLKVKENCRELLVTVTDISNGHLTIDANHPLAGKNLRYEIQVVDIR